MALIYRHATRAVECDRCRQSSHPAEIGELEAVGWQERGFAYHLCPDCTGHFQLTTDAAADSASSRVA